MNLEDYLEIEKPTGQDILSILHKNTGLNFIRKVMSRIPDECRNESFYLEAIKIEAQVFNYLGKYDSEFIAKAVSVNGMVMSYIDYNQQNLELALIAVKNNGLAINSLSSKLGFNSQVCEEAVRNNPLALKYIKIQSDEICLLAVGINGEALEFAISHTPRMCVVAVRNNPNAIRFVRRLVSVDGIMMSLEETMTYFYKIVDTEDNQKLIKDTIKSL